jgi:hypothetical protein
MEVLCISETLVSNYKITWRHNSEDRNANLHCRENLNSQMYDLFIRKLSNNAVSTVETI